MSRPTATTRTTSPAARYAKVAGVGLLVTALPVSALLLGLWRVGGDVRDSDRQVTELRMRTLMAAIDRYSADNDGRLPSSHEGLKAVLPYLSAGPADPDAAWWAELPKDGWGQYFLYFSPGVHVGQPYELISLGADGEPGGTGPGADVASWLLADAEPLAEVR